MIKNSTYLLEKPEKTKIEIYCKRKGITLGTLATERLGISPAMLSSMINGKKPVIKKFKEFLENELKFKFK